MSISLYTLLIVYLLFVFLFVILSMFNIFHLIKFGFYSYKPIFMIVFFILGTAGVLTVSIILMLQIDWSLSWQITPSVNIYNLPI